MRLTLHLASSRYGYLLYSSFYIRRKLSASRIPNSVTSLAVIGRLCKHVDRRNYLSRIETRHVHFRRHLLSFAFALAKNTSIACDCNYPLPPRAIPLYAHLSLQSCNSISPQKRRSRMKWYVSFANSSLEEIRSLLRKIECEIFRRKRKSRSVSSQTFVSRARETAIISYVTPRGFGIR